MVAGPPWPPLWKHPGSATGLHFILQHLDRPGTYVRILFVDFSSVLTPSFDTLQNKLTQLSVPTSPLLFSLYTIDCTSKDPSVKFLKFADDTTLISLIQDGDESAYRQEVKELAVWCSLNNLELNTFKTVEMIVDLRRNHLLPPPWITLWLQWSHSDSWAPQFLRTWSGTNTLNPLWKRPSRGCISFASWESSTYHRSCWNSSTLPSLNPSSAHQ